MTSRLTESMWHGPHDTQSPTGEGVVYDGHFALRELVIQYCEHIEAQPVDELTHSSNGLPISIYLPENYEPNYAYPLVIWLHGEGGTEDDIQLLMPLISDRNYIGMAIRAPWDSWTDAEAPEADTLQFEQDLHDTVGRVRKQLNIHSERVYLSGFGGGATMAARLLLNRPQWFAGASMMGGQLPDASRSLSKMNSLRGKRVLWMAGETDRTFDAETTGRTLRTLHTAGLETSIRTFDTGHQIVEGMLNELNTWIMKGISTATMV